MFLNKKNELKEEPLKYWEEKSYMLAVPNEWTDDILENIFDRVSAIEGVEVKETVPLTEKEPGLIKLIYEDEEFEVGFFPDSFSLSQMCVNNNYYFIDEEKEKLNNAKSALKIFMEFHKDVKKSFHLQLKIAVASVPNLIGVMDESAEKIFPSTWAIMAANSKVLPSSNDLYTVQAISGENGEVWLHTHGLCRCGFTELEILQSDKENSKKHFNLLTTYASYIIDKKNEFDPRKESAYIGMLANRQPVVVTCVSWTEGLQEYKKLKLGNLKDRKEGHNSKTSIVFIYKTEEDEQNKKISKISEYNDLWGDNPIFFISNEETNRMKALARERFHFVKEVATKEYNKALIKIGLPVDDGEEDEFEHIWFELLKFNGDKFKARLIQEPYNVKDVHVGYEDWYTIENVTDWIIHTPNFSATPGNAYLLIK